MTALLPALARYLAAHGHGVYSDTTPYGPDDIAIELDEMPASPDRCVVLALEGNGGGSSNSNEPYDTARIRVRVRGGPDYLDAATRAQAVYDALQGLGTVDLPGGVTLANAVCMQGSPVRAGTDGNGRREQIIDVACEWLNPTALRPL